MHLRFSKDELATLMEMVSLATEVANMNPDEVESADFRRFEELENKILESAKHAGFSDWIEIDEGRGKHRVTMKFQEESYFQKCLEEFRNVVFWEDLMIRLAERDYVREIGQQAYLAMEEEDRRKKLEPLEQRYWKKFRADGIDPLHWIDRSMDG